VRKATFTALSPMANRLTYHGGVDTQIISIAVSRIQAKLLDGDAIKSISQWIKVTAPAGWLLTQVPGQTSILEPHLTIAGM
ncbi:hypothetical protein DSO57_1003907, partial [Entomophthora muscae]